ncbi:MAG: hypothetical protein JWM80_3921 [Cyanobacteria bacterium RYN_339]|nr:hypothetical protein [Cyanobacteria bacterium RYN_339]
MTIASTVSREILGGVRKASTRAGRSVQKQLAPVVERDVLALSQGDATDALLKKFDKASKLPTPAQVTAKEQATLAARFPLWAKNHATVEALLDPNLPLSRFNRLTQLRTVTDAHSGTYKLAGALLEAERVAPNLGTLLPNTYLTERLRGSINCSDVEVAQRLLSVFGQLRGSWPVRSEGLQALNHLLLDLPGLPAEMRRPLEAAQQMDGELANLYPNHRWSFFSSESSRGVARDPMSPTGYTRTDLQQKLAHAYQQGFAGATAIRVPGAAAAAVDAAEIQQGLVKQLLDLKVRDQNAWRIYAGEDWSKLDQTALGTTSAQETSNAVVQDRSLLSTIFNGGRRETSGHAVASSASSSTVSGKVATSVDMLIPGTQSSAPRVSLDHVLDNPGDYLVTSRGRVHVVNSENPADWFAIAKHDVAR